MLHVPCSLDIDECSSGSHVCHVNANCINAAGSHNCTCKEGFTGDGHTCLGTANFSLLHVTCSTDIVECSNGSHVCDVNANCTNTVGSHNCTCKKGFTRDGRSCSGTLNSLYFQKSS